MEDVCKLIVDYGRTQIVGNEEQFLATVLALSSGFSPDPCEYISTLLAGETSSGKTHVQRTAVSLFPEETVYHLTASSSKAGIYSDHLKDPRVRIIVFSELQKLDGWWLEIMKSMSGDDNEFRYEVTDKRTTIELRLPKRAFTVTYAQGKIDEELKSRLFIIPVEVNLQINRLAYLSKLKAHDLEYNGQTYIHSDEQYVSRTRSALMGAIAMLANEDAQREAHLPFPQAFEGMVDYSRPECKRHGELIYNLMAQSCRLNVLAREVDSAGRLVVSAQDVVNVLSLTNLLRATVMELDLIDVHVYNFLRQNPMSREVDINAELVRCGMQNLTRKEMQRRLEKMLDYYYIVKQTVDHEDHYSVNPRRQPLNIHIDWATIHDHDSGPVVSPLTGDRFNDIIEFGAWFEQEYGVKRITREEAQRRVEERKQDWEAQVRARAAELADDGMPEWEGAQVLAKEFSIDPMQALAYFEEVSAIAEEITV